jgi:hypothetical protein
VVSFVLLLNANRKLRSAFLTKQLLRQNASGDQKWEKVCSFV